MGLGPSWQSHRFTQGSPCCCTQWRGVWFWHLAWLISVRGSSVSSCLFPGFATQGEYDAIDWGCLLLFSCSVTMGDHEVTKPLLLSWTSVKSLQNDNLYSPDFSWLPWPFPHKRSGVGFVSIQYPQWRSPTLTFCVWIGGQDHKVILFSPKGQGPHLSQPSLWGGFEQ